MVSIRNAYIFFSYVLILLPFLIWDFWASLVAIPLGIGIKETISKFFISNGELCWNAPIWFLLVLFIAESIYAIIAKYNRLKSTTLLVLIASVILRILIGASIYPLKLNLVPLVLFFYGLGDIFHTLSNKHLTSKTPTIVMVLMGIFIIVLLLQLQELCFMF